jgi:hypothetical protein
LELEDLHTNTHVNVQRYIPGTKKMSFEPLISDGDPSYSRSIYQALMDIANMAVISGNRPACQVIFEIQIIQLQLIQGV